MLTACVRDEGSCRVLHGMEWCMGRIAGGMRGGYKGVLGGRLVVGLVVGVLGLTVTP